MERALPLRPVTTFAGPNPEVEKMFARLVGGGTAVAQLKEGLDASSKAVRSIAHRVANAGTPDFAQAFDEAQATGVPGEDGVDLEREMVALADEQLRFEATASLLQKSYQQLRSSVRER
jgi:flagellar basal body rod protein FlgB